MYLEGSWFRVCGLFSINLVLLALLVGIPIAAGTSDSHPPQDKNLQSLNITAGTVLPVRLNQGLSSKNAKPGQSITARIMQDVPLPNNQKIPEGAKVLGTIVSVQRAANGADGSVSFRFDTLAIHQRKIPIITSLRALAGFMEVQSAQTPEFTPGFGSPFIWSNTRQIGGDEVYGVGGPVTNRWNEPVGKGVYDGVLVHVRAQPESKCRGALDPEDRLQALWVFSSDACGVYGILGLSIANAGRSDPLGEVVLTADQKDVLVRGASAMLLRVLR